jgi:hypothetical protein
MSLSIERARPEGRSGRAARAGTRASTGPRSVVAAPPDPMPLLRRPVPRILLALQVAARRRQRAVPKVVAHKAQVDLLVGHVRAGGVAQPVRRGAGQDIGLRFPLGPARLQALGRHAEHLFQNQVQSPA